MRMTGGPNLEFGSDRMGFIRKVSILPTQLLVTVAIIVAFVGLVLRLGPVQERDRRERVPRRRPRARVLQLRAQWDVLCLTDFGYSILSNSWVTWVLFVPMIAFICLLHCVKNTYPVNYIVLFLYTGVMGVFLGFICTSYFAAGWGDRC